MATEAQKVKTTRTPKFPTQAHKRCMDCFRHNIFRLGRCRLCFKSDADRGDLPGFTKTRV
jgi:ribosomal protein S14